MRTALPLHHIAVTAAAPSPRLRQSLVAATVCCTTASATVIATVSAARSSSEELHDTGCHCL
jgi:hypothetical protein